MPDFYLFGGPNGAGKTTLALTLLPQLGVPNFINADLIARGLSPLDSDAVAFQAGAMMMRRLREMAQKGVNFGTESTLAARAFVPFIRECQSLGYTFNLIYVWSGTPELSVQRVAARVRAGGHHVPEVTIRRRFEAGRQHFLRLYLPLADTWKVYDNTNETRIVAQGVKGCEPQILIPAVWLNITQPPTLPL